MTGSEPAHGNLTPPRISPSCPHCVILQPDGFQMLWTNPEFIAAFQQFVTHSQTLFPLLRHCVIQILRENRVRRQGNHAAGCRISTVVLCLFLVLFHISPQRGRNIDQPQNNTYLSKLSPSTQQMDGAKVDENCPPVTEHSPLTSEFQISRSSSSSKSQALSTSEP